MIRQYINQLKGDRVIWIIALLMLGFSLVSVYSFVPILVKIEGGSPFKYLSKHLVYVLIGFLLMVWVHKKDPKYISRLSKFGYYLAIALLIFTFFFGSKVNDAGRWIKIPFVGLTFQSSDFAKLAIIIYLSRLLVNKKDVLSDWKNGYLRVLLPAGVICGLIFKDNFSTSVLLFAICLTMMFIGRTPFSKLILTLVSGIGIIGVAILLHKSLPELNLLPRYQTWENRILNKMDREDDVISNAQSMNAELAIYNGALIGQGVGDGKLKEFIPEAYADFYYASYVEEFGLISAFILVFLYIVLLYRIIRIGMKSENLFETYVCVGIGILILTQASVNMMVCTGIFPVTGQNMPLLAMGGSALIMTCLEIGIVQAIAFKCEKQKESENEISVA